MNDDEMKKLIHSLDRVATPPEGLRERVLVRTLALKAPAIPPLSALEKFLFEKPLSAAASFAFVVSGTLWAMMGGGFAALLGKMIG